MTNAPVRTTVHHSPLGPLTIVASSNGLVAVLWPDDEPSRVRLERNDAGAPIDSAAVDAADSEAAAAVLRSTASQLDEYFDGDRQEFDLPLDLRGTEFQVTVWQSLADIAYGETATYAQQAATIGRPSAVRAVGGANGRNPVSIVLPCHRVVGASGKLTGFAGGLDAKRFLLDHEAGQASLL